MAIKKKTAGETGGPSLIDPIYSKFTRAVVRALGSEDFYQFFMNAVACADNEIRFSNRREVKAVDVAWVDAVEEALPGFQNIVSMPRQSIREEELIVNIAHAKKTGPDVVRHLASHAGLVEDYDEVRGDVRPSKVLQKYREETLGQYENRLVFTALEQAYHFVKIRHDALFSAMGDEFGAKLKVRSDMDSATEHVHMDMFMHIKNTQSILDVDDKNRDIFDRISRLYRVLGMFMTTEFARELAGFDRVKGPIHKTNILKRNPDYRAAVKLLEFLRSYDDIGYVISVVEQAPEVDETLQRDIFHNILFNYIVLKGYLEDDRDREIPLARKPKQRKLRPKFVHEIIEELTEDYDLPDVEIRRVLIEELTKEQLLLEEEAERRRLVEEQEQRKKEEEERLRAEREAERARIRAEREAERERVRQEKEAEKQRLMLERMQREAEERRRSTIFKQELEYFGDHLMGQLELRQEEAERKAALAEKQKQEYEDAARLIEEEEQRRLEEREREQLLRQEEQERILREQRLAEEQVRREREAAEAKAREEQRERDLAALAPYIAELEFFARQSKTQRELRAAQAERIRREQEAREKARRERLARRSAIR